MQGPDFVESYYGVSSSLATYALGVITVISGIFGTGCGSIFLNKLMIKYEVMKASDSIKSEVLEKYRVEKACTIMPIGIFLGCVLATAGVLFSPLFSKPYDYACFFVGVGLGEFFIFTTISPTAIAIMSCVPNHLRGQANALSVFVMHALGDFPSPALIGAWFQIFGDYVGMILAVGWLVFAVIFWTIGWNMSVTFI